MLSKVEQLHQKLETTCGLLQDARTLRSGVYAQRKADLQKIAYLTRQCAMIATAMVAYGATKKDFSNTTVWVADQLGVK